MQPAYFIREFERELGRRLLAKSPFIQIIAGPRQVGKSTAVLQLRARWPGTVVSVSADDLLDPSPAWVETHWRKARLSGPRTLLIIDEIQRIPRWSSVVKRLFDEDRHNPDLQVVILGSASLQLQQGLTESLAGRFEIIAAPHWSFGEMKKLSGAEQMTVDEFLTFGGYPAPIALLPELQRFRQFILNSIIEPVIGRDIQSLVTIERPALFRQVVALACCYPAQIISYSKLMGQLQERGSVPTIKHYLEIAAGAYLLSLVPKFSGSDVISRTSSPKIVPHAPAIIAAFANSERSYSDPSWRGRLLEAAIGSHLCRSYGELYYWRDGRDEVDFVLRRDQTIIAIEVKTGMAAKHNGLQAFCRKYPKSLPLILDAKLLEDFLLSDNVDAWLDKNVSKA